MAESMKGLHRSHRCTEVSSANIGEKVTVMGWVQKRRNLGSLIFIDLRDRSGLLQIVFDEESVGAHGFSALSSFECPVCADPDNGISDEYLPWSGCSPQLQTEVSVTRIKCEGWLRSLRYLRSLSFH